MNSDNHLAVELSQIIKELESHSDPKKKEILPRFFKTGRGEYGEGDLFLGISVPNIRLVAKGHITADYEVVAALLRNPWHECRLCALLILVEQFKRADTTKRRSIYEFYLSQTPRINNWDLVDLSAPYIVGEFLLKHGREDLYRLADSPSLWEQRIAVVSTLTLIRHHDFADIWAIAEKLRLHPHDLIQKATGWMLREMGKRNKERLVKFLEKHKNSMPRTMLRYAIEKFSKEERAYFMKKE